MGRLHGHMRHIHCVRAPWADTHEALRLLDSHVGGLHGHRHCVRASAKKKVNANKNKNGGLFV